MAAAAAQKPTYGLLHTASVCAAAIENPRDHYAGTFIMATSSHVSTQWIDNSIDYF